jgi:hypothetical protein
MQWKMHYFIQLLLADQIHQFLGYHKKEIFRWGKVSQNPGVPQFFSLQNYLRQSSNEVRKYRLLWSLSQ